MFLILPTIVRATEASIADSVPIQKNISILWSLRLRRRRAGCIITNACFPERFDCSLIDIMDRSQTTNNANSKKNFLLSTTCYVTKLTVHRVSRQNTQPSPKNKLPQREICAATKIVVHAKWYQWGEAQEYYNFETIATDCLANGGKFLTIVFHHVRPHEWSDNVP